MRAAGQRFEGEEFRVGGIFSMTGYLSWSGEQKKKAAVLKVDMVNEAGGINGQRLRLIGYDDQSSPNLAARVAEGLIFRHGVIALVGTGSLPISRAVAQIANRYRIPAFLSSGYAVDPVKDRFVFNTAHKTEFAVACSFQYFREEGINRIGLLMPHGPLGELGSRLGRRLADRLGIKIVGEERFDVGAPDVTFQLERLRDAKPLALFSFVTGEPAAHVARRMAQQGFNVPLLVSHGNANPAFLKLVSHISVPLIVPSGKSMVLDSIPETDPCKTILDGFNARHMQRYGGPANYCSAELGDAIDLLSEGLRATGPEPGEMCEAIENIRAFNGMQGTYDFSPIDHYGTQLEHVVLLVVKDGTWHLAKTFSSIPGLEEMYGDRKARLISRLDDLLCGPARDALVRSRETAAFKAPVDTESKEEDTRPDPGLYLVTKLHCQQKRELIQSIRKQDDVKAKQILYQLLSLALLRHFDSLEQLKITILELFLAMIDAAVEEGVDIELLAKLKQGFGVEWEHVKDQETLSLWIVRVLDSVSDNISKQRRESGLLTKVLRFVEAHYTDDLTVDRIAREVGLSPSRLIHRIRSEHGLTVGDCVAKTRMEKAQALLKNTDMPIGKIAYEVGYNDQSYFTKVFKKRVNCTPRAFRDGAFKFPPSCG